jgi:hypothetical protein
MNSAAFIAFWRCVSVKKVSDTEGGIWVLFTFFLKATAPFYHKKSCFYPQDQVLARCH